RLTVDESVDLARVSLGWIVPPAYSDDDYALSVASAVLAGGKATRLYRELVVRQKLASDVNAELDSNQLAGIAQISATVASGTPLEKLEPALDRVIEDLGKAAPTAAEVERAKRRITLGLLDDLQLL